MTRELAARGRELLVLREPGGVELSERIRSSSRILSCSVDPRAEALLYAAARAQLVAEQLVPLLATGRGCCSTASSTPRSPTRVRGAGSAIEAIRTLNEFATGGLAPDRTLLLRIDPAVGRARIAGREADRLEQAGDAFFAAVAAAYDELAAAEPDRIAVIEADRPPEQVLADALAALEPLLSAGA